MPRSATVALTPLAAAAAFVGSLALAAPADAATTISRSVNVITLTGDAAPDRIVGGGEHGGAQVTFYAGDAATSLLAGPGCRFLPGRDRDGHRELSCGRTARPANPLTLQAELGAGNDELKLNWNTDRHPKGLVNGGEGDDQIWGTILSDRLDGGPGDDVIDGRQDRDGLRGGIGNDTLIGGADSDVISGEQGVDQLYGDGLEGTPDPREGFSGIDLIDSTDFPVDVRGYTAEQIAALPNEADVVDCGPGAADSIVADDLDVPGASCELVKRVAGASTPVDLSPVYPATYAITPRSRYDLRASVVGEPIRFVTTSSAGGATTTRLVISAADARRLRVPRTLGSVNTLMVVPVLPVEQFLRLSGNVRSRVAGARNLRARIVSTTTYPTAGGTGTESLTQSVSIRLR